MLDKTSANNEKPVSLLEV